MSKNDTIKNFHSFYISTLLFRNNIRKNCFEVDGNYLCDNLVDDIAEGNRPKLLWVGDMLLFRNQGEECGIKRL